MNVQTGVAGFINIQVKHADGTMSETGWFKNLILDTFFARYAAGNTMISGNITCRVGTGATPPANTDIALVSQVATKTRTNSSEVLGAIDIPNNRVVAKSINQFIFDVGSVAANLSEVGFEFAPGSGGLNSGQLNSRSLTKNNMGVPTTITVTASDQLIVNYKLEVYISLTDYTGTVILDGVTYDVLGRVAGDYGTTGASVANILLGPDANNSAFRAYGSASVFGAHGVAPTSPSGTNSATSTLYTNISGGKEREYQASINQLNATGGIKVITIPIATSQSGSNNGYKYQFTPVIPKDATKLLRLRFRMTCVRV